MSIFDSFQQIVNKDITIFEADNMFQEIDFIVMNIKEDVSKTITIISPNKLFSKLICFRLNTENIDHNSYLSDFWGDSNIYNHDFLDEISKHFGDIRSDSENDSRKLIEELSCLFEFEKKSAKINVINSVQSLSADVVICVSMNEEDWSPMMCGAYWLHQSLRRKIGLNSSEFFKRRLEEKFITLLKGNSDVILTRSKKSNGLNLCKSSILKKLELLCKKNHKDLKCCSFSKYFNQSYVDSEPVCNNQRILTVKDLEFLMKDPSGFYAKNILELESDDFDKTQRNIRYAMKMVVMDFFKSGESGALNWLSFIRDIDFFSYQQGKNIVGWLKEREYTGVAYNNIFGRVANKNVDLSGYIDRVENDVMIVYTTSIFPLTADILYGADCSIVAICWIAEQGGFQEISKPIREVQIWNIGSFPVLVKSIEISEDVIVEFENRLYDAMNGNYTPETKLEYDIYKHFKRIK
ncbi:MAG: hypothetical protein LBF70_01735 [Holosporales bacterium]|jgi:hypothetical protein|nr:hypothetical protein [Holosporales bacterium]